MTERLERCDLCESPLHDAEPVYVFNGFPLVRCRSCGLVLTNPRPTRDEIARYYGDGYYAYLPQQAPSRKERIKDWALRELGGYPNQVRGWRKAVVKSAAFLLRPHIMVIPPFVPGGRLLDAGCGSGSFLRWAIGAGWDATGLEVDPRGAEQGCAARLPIIQGGMEDCPLEDRSLDTVVLNHTLEHCHEPNRVLAQCRRVLKDGGLLIVGVPNFDCRDNRIFRDCWSNCEAPRHLYHFTTRTLSLMLEKHGFTLDRIRYKKWLIPYSERISFRFLRRKLAARPWHERTGNLLRARFRIQVVKKLAQIFHIRPERELAQMMTAYARKKA